MSVDGDSEYLRRKLTDSAAWVVLERWGARVLSLVVFVILARLVEPEMFGTVALALSIVALMQVLVDAGYSRALVQARDLGAKDAATAFWTSVLLSLLMYVGLFFLAPLLSTWLDNDELAPVLRVLALTLPVLTLSQTPAALLERSLDFKPLSVRQLVAATAGSLVAVPLALVGFGVWALVAQALVAAVVSLVVMWASTPWRPGWSYSFASLRRLSRIGLSVLGTQILDAVQMNVDKIVVGIFFSPDILGYYFLAQRLVIILTELVGAVISRVALSTFARVQDDPARLNRIFRQMMFASGVVGVPLFGLTALFAEQIVPTLFGPGWDPMIPLLWGLAGAGALTTMMYLDRTALLATGHVHAMIVVVVAQSVVSTVLLFALLPLGIVGVVISQWGRVLTWPVRLFILRRSIGASTAKTVSQVGRCVLPLLPVATIVVLLQLTPWAEAPWPLLTFVAPITVVVLPLYLALAWRLAGTENRQGLRPFVAKVLKRRPSN